MKKILIVGATGNLGPHLVKELVKQGHQVSALIRPVSISNSDKTSPLKQQGVRIVEGDLEDQDSLDRACAGQDVVISCAGAEQIAAQRNLAIAAAKAGVSRMIPSEFGVDPHGASENSCELFDIKAMMQVQIKETGVPTTMIYTNGFMEFWGTGLGQLGAMSPPDHVQLYGSGHTPAHMCTLGDIARFTAKIMDDPRTLNQEVGMHTNATTQEDLIQTWESLSGKKVTREPVSSDDLENIINNATAPEEMVTKIFAQLHRSVWVRGDSNNVRPEVLQVTDLYPEIEVTTLQQYFSYFL